MSELDTAIRHFRALRTKREASSARALQDAFARARDGLQAQLDGMVAWLDANPDPPLWRVLAEHRTRNLLMQAEFLFNQYSREVGDTIHREQAVAVAQAQSDAKTLIEKGFGTPPVGVGTPFVALPQQAIGQLTATLQPGAPVRKLLDEFGGDAADAVQSELIAGVASGRSPRQTARAISDALGGQYDRAFLITRTETLRAYRGAQQAIYEENAHLLEGWIWHASLSTRTCAACWAMHGTLHPVTETMSEHPAGRCSMIPRTKSWKDLGYDVPDTRPDIEPGVDVFNRLNSADQQMILGPSAYKAFRGGSIELQDLVHVHQSRTWGETRSVGSVEGAKARAAKRGPTTFDFLKFPDTEFGKRLEAGANAIQRVHRVEGAPSIPVKVLRRNDAQGVYDFDINRGTPKHVGVSPKADAPELAIIHELGHFFDHQVLGTKGLFRSGNAFFTGDARMNALNQALHDSGAIQKLIATRSDYIHQRLSTGEIIQYEPDQEYMRYLLDTTEVFARAYSQYITVRSGDPTLLKQFHKTRRQADESGYTEFWSDDDFVPIGKAMDDLFRDKGWLK